MKSQEAMKSYYRIQKSSGIVGGNEVTSWNEITRGWGTRDFLLWMGWEKKYGHTESYYRNIQVKKS